MSAINVNIESARRFTWPWWWTGPGRWPYWPNSFSLVGIPVTTQRRTSRCPSILRTLFVSFGLEMLRRPRARVATCARAPQRTRSLRDNHAARGVGF